MVVRIEGDDVPGPEVVAVVALCRVTGGRPEIPVVALPASLMIADRGTGDVLQPSPTGLIGTEKS